MIRHHLDDDATLQLTMLTAQPTVIETAAHGAVFIRIHSSARCCRWQCYASGQACLGSGAVIGALATDIVKNLPKVRSPKTPAACAENCAKVGSRCTFFSHAVGLRACMLCAACDLDRTTLGRWNGKRFTSWARIGSNRTSSAAAGSTHHPSASTSVIIPNSLAANASALTVEQLYERTSASSMVWKLLGPLVQRAYSTHLYGAPDRVDLSSLRLLWLALLPERAQRAISAFGVCRHEAKPPLQPLLTAIDLNANPRDAVLVQQQRGGPVVDEGKRAGLLLARPVPNHSWIEV